MNLSQKNRFLSIDTPLGKDALMLVGIKGREALSEGFRFDLDLISENDAIVFKDIIGENVTVSLILNKGKENEKVRYINGIVASFQQGAAPKEMGEASVAGEYYSAVVVPWLWLLTRMTNCRIFQEKNVKEIVEQIVNDRGTFDFEWKLSNESKYKKRTYCVQYRETDFNFISRLLAEEGIHYFFKHQEGKHTMVLADSPDGDPPCELHEKVKFHSGSTDMLDDDYITSMSRSLDITVTKHTLKDFNFESPNAPLLVETDTNQEENKNKGEREIYDFPGNYIEYSHGEHFGKIRMEAHEVRLTTISGTSQCKGFGPGYHFELKEYFRTDLNDRKYLLTSVEHEAILGYEPFGIRTPASYSNQFTCIPFEVPYRPPQKSRKPVIQGVQTAIVVGPSGEEIYPDKYGRVKVQFHWDREGKNDEKSSCWIRVSQSWAGAGWGAMYIPRLGQEVIVSFIEGNPDRPIITGCVYHGTNAPPYPLPAEKTKSTIKSDSSTGGGGSNEIRFEDKKGSEEIFVHGQKDWTIAIDNDKNQTVGNNESLSVGTNRSKTVGSDQSESIGANKNITVGSNHTETVGANKTETIGSNLSLSVGANQTDTVAVAKAVTIGAAYQITVGAAMNETVGGAKAEEIGAVKSVNVGANSNENVGGDKSVDAGKNISEKAGKDMAIESGKKMNLTAGDDFALSGKKKGLIELKDELTLKVGSASITMKKNGDITIKGAKINIKGSGDIVIKGSKILEN